MKAKQTAAGNNINSWPSFLDNVDPSTQIVQSPFSDPVYVADPTMIDTTGATIHLKPSDWPTPGTAEQIAFALGGETYEIPPAMPGVTFNQPNYGIRLTGPGTNNTAADCPFLAGGVTTASVIANCFPKNKALLEDALPKILGIVAGG
jgi:hypothetical protein